MKKKDGKFLFMNGNGEYEAFSKEELEILGGEPLRGEESFYYDDLRAAAKKAWEECKDRDSAEMLFYEHKVATGGGIFYERSLTKKDIFARRARKELRKAVFA